MAEDPALVDLSSAFRVDGKTAVVTGGSQGIGLSIAEHLAAAGAAVVVVARTQSHLDSAVRRLENYGGRVVGVRGDVTDPVTRDRAVRCCVDELGSLDILVNNAALRGPRDPLIDCDLTEVLSVVHHNQMAPLAWAQAAVHSWMREHGGVIVNISSLGGLQAKPGVGAYGQAKAALDHQTRVLALELAPKIRVNSVAPGLIYTDFSITNAPPAERERKLAQRRPMVRLGEPADIGRAVLFLASDAASWVTGLVVPIDGGQMLLSNP